MNIDTHDLRGLDYVDTFPSMPAPAHAASEYGCEDDPERPAGPGAAAVVWPALMALALVVVALIAAVL